MVPSRGPGRTAHALTDLSQMNAPWGLS